MGASVYPRRFRDRLAAGPPLLLDGATGTELERRGIACALPLWTAHALVDAPDDVAAIHRAYVEAGAEIVTANTFRTQSRTLARGGLGERAAELTALAVALARRAAGEAAFVAGSMPPLEDCYRPDLAPDDASLAREHAEHAVHLSRAGVDVLLLETHNSIREAVAATRAAKTTSLPVWISFVCDGGARLPSGEPLAAAIAEVTACAPDAVGVNCLPVAHVAAALDVLRAAPQPFAVFANLGAPTGPDAPRTHDVAPADYARHACAEWLGAGARIVGGCCGTTPAHVAALAAAMRSPHSAGG